MRTQYDRYPNLKGLPNNEKMKEYSRAYRGRNPNKTLYMAAKCRAKKRGLDFTIDYEDVIIPEICPVLGIKLVVRAGNGIPGGKLDSPSLDRIDNTKGYVKGNIQVISHMANSMKFTASPKELKLFAEWIMKTYD